jgi:threonine dehydrogenase-like Zn-dependent dehydrogenase
MKALCWEGVSDIRYETVPDPKIEDGRDAIIKVTCCAICGSDLHLYDGFMPGMKHGDIMGHEFMGEVVEVGKANKKLKAGDRVVVPFTIICGECEQCKRGNFSVCERSYLLDHGLDARVEKQVRRAPRPASRLVQHRGWGA